MPRSTITSILSGASPEASVETTRKLAQALGRPTDALLKEPGAELPPHGTTPLESALSEFLASKWADYLQPRPQPEDLAWLRSLSSVFWLDVPPNPEALHHLIKARRAGLI